LPFEIEILFYFFKKILFKTEQKGGRGSLSRWRGIGRGRSILPTEQGAQHGVPSQDSRIMT